MWMLNSFIDFVVGQTLPNLDIFLKKEAVFQRSSCGIYGRKMVKFYELHNKCDEQLAIQVSKPRTERASPFKIDFSRASFKLVPDEIFRFEVTIKFYWADVDKVDSGEMTLQEETLNFKGAFMNETDVDPAQAIARGAYVSSVVVASENEIIDHKLPLREITFIKPEQGIVFKPPYNRPLIGQFSIENGRRKMENGYPLIAYRINCNSHWLTFTPKEGIISSEFRPNKETIQIDVKPILGLNFKLHFGEFDCKKQLFNIEMTFVKEGKPSFANPEDEESAFEGAFLENAADLIARVFEKARKSSIYTASVRCNFDIYALGEFEDDLIGKMPLTIRPSILTFKAPFTPSCQAVLTLKNSKSSDYTFRILLSDTDRYTAQPSDGVIAKGNRDGATFFNISIYLEYKFLGVDRSKDHISVLVATIADNARDFVTVMENAIKADTTVTQSFPIQFEEDALEDTLLSVGKIALHQEFSLSVSPTTLYFKGPYWLRSVAFLSLYNPNICGVAFQMTSTSPWFGWQPKEGIIAPNSETAITIQLMPLYGTLGSLPLRCFLYDKLDGVFEPSEACFIIEATYVRERCHTSNKSISEIMDEAESTDTVMRSTIDGFFDDDLLNEALKMSHKERI